jgi:uncharacterized Zn finger protein
MAWYGYDDYGFRPYVSVAQRRAKARREMAKLAKKGYVASPIAIEGRTIAATFWGRAWCDNLESYSDFANRLPRGRTYVRNGSVVDLRVEAGEVIARVMGSELYDVRIKIKSLAPPTWSQVKSRCAGQIGSLVELLQGKLSRGVMDIVTCHDDGLFPKPKEIEMDCSCPDYAGMCKHIAAVLYGVGARLDTRPELLFQLRQVNHLDLIAEAGTAAVAAPGGAKSRKARHTIAADQLAGVFGIEIDDPAGPPAPPPRHGREPEPLEALPKRDRAPARHGRAATTRRRSPKAKVKAKP